jgi:uncharacterized protein
MPAIELLRSTLTSPMVLAFALGVIATVAGSDLRLPRAMASGLSIYLLFAIGLKGGVALSGVGLGEIFAPALATLALGVITPLVAFAAALRLLPVGRLDASALAAHYGSVSAVTFATALTVFEGAEVGVEGFAPALLAMLEIPGIIVALMLASNVVSGARGGWGRALREAVLGKSIVLLAGGLAIGFIAGPGGTAQVDPLFRDLFLGALTLFLLDLGVSAAHRAGSLRAAGPGLLVLGTCVPLVNGSVGVLLGTAAGLSVGGSALLGIMAASASYIAAPAAVRVALPDANPAYYLTASLGITFPLNLIFGIPLFFAIANSVG